MGDTGTFSLESWSCQARGFMTRGPGFEAGDLEGSCGYAVSYTVRCLRQEWFVNECGMGFRLRRDG